MNFREEKASSALCGVIAEFFSKRKILPGIIATVEKVELSSDFKNATVVLRVYPPEKRGEALITARKELGEMREYVKEHLKIKDLPFFKIEMDNSEG